MDAATDNATAPTMTLDDAVRLMTAWTTWQAMRDELRRVNASYAPTLRDDDAAAPEPQHKEAIRLIREACDVERFRWYDGNNLHNEPRRRARPIGDVLKESFNEFDAAAKAS